MRYKTQNQMHKVLSNVIRLLHENGVDNINISYVENKIYINPHDNSLGWEILEGMGPATDSPMCTWSIATLDTDELQIILENDL